MNNKLFVAILSCETNKERRDKQRDLWVSDLNSMDIAYSYFMGGSGYQRDHLDDEVIIQCDDGYNHLPNKVKLMLSWVLSEMDCDWILKVDDDVILRPESLLDVNYYRAEYRPLPLPNWEMNFPQGGHPNERPIGGVLDLAGRFNIGGGYLLSRRAAGIVADSKIPSGQIYEDRFVCEVLKNVGIVFDSHPSSIEIATTIAEYLLEYGLVLPTTEGKKRFAISEAPDISDPKIDLRHNLPCIRDTFGWIANRKAAGQ